MTAPVIVQCPPWCAVDDHEQWGGTTHHKGYAVELRALPYEVGCARTGVTVAYESANVVLSQDDGCAPVIAIEMPDSREANPADGVPMTLAEAAELRDSLSSLIAEGQTGDSQ